MAVCPAHGGRSKPAAGSGDEKRTRRKPQRVSLWLPPSQTRYPNGHHVSHGAEGTSGGYIPFFVTERKRSEAALIQVVQEAFVQGVSTRKMEKLAKSLGIESLSRSQVSEMTKGLNEQVNAFRSALFPKAVIPFCGWMLCTKKFVWTAEL